MGGRGPRPKPDGQRRRRNRPTFEWAEVPAVPFVGGPKLGRPPGWLGVWPTRTKQWWVAVSSMPHCVLWVQSDWQFALDTALIAARFHSGQLPAAAELRHRERLLGMTADGRASLRIRYVADDQGDEEDASVTAIADYRAMLLEDPGSGSNRVPS